jgi:hypothetical protein
MIPQFRKKVLVIAELQQLSVNIQKGEVSLTTMSEDELLGLWQWAMAETWQSTSWKDRAEILRAEVDRRTSIKNAETSTVPNRWVAYASVASVVVALIALGFSLWKR